MTTPPRLHLGPADSKLLTPGSPERSELYLRMKTRGESKMPPLATFYADQEALQAIRLWVESLSAK